MKKEEEGKCCGSKWYKSPCMWKALVLGGVIVIACSYFVH